MSMCFGGGLLYHSISTDSGWVVRHGKFCLHLIPLKLQNQYKGTATEAKVSRAVVSCFTMGFTHQLLLKTPSNAMTVLFCIFCLPPVVLFTTFLGSCLIQVTHSDPGMISAHVCDSAYDPGMCLSFISDAMSNDGVQETSAIDVVHTLLSKSLQQMKVAMEEDKHTTSRLANDREVRASLADCLELMGMLMDRVNDIVAALPNWRIKSHLVDIHTLLSGALANHVICLNEINIIRGSGSPFESLILNSIAIARTYLAVISSVSAADKDVTQSLNEEIPAWLAGTDTNQNTGRNNPEQSHLSQS